MLFQTLLCTVAMIAGPAAAMSIPSLEDSNEMRARYNQQTCTNRGEYQCAIYNPREQSITHCSERGVLSTIKTCDPSEECIKRNESNIAYCYPRST